MKKLLPTDLWAIEVPEDGYDFSVLFLDPYFRVRCELPSTELVDISGGFALFYKDFGGKSKYPKDVSVIGTVTKDSIDFDAEPFLIKNGPLTKDRVYLFEDYTECSLGFENAQESFYSLLQANGFHFVNPCDKPETEYDSEGHPHYPLQEYIDEWQKYENALVKKLLILQHI